MLAHPYVAVTGETGTYEIAGLGAGTYTVEVWHGALGSTQQVVTVTADDTKELDFALKK